MDANRTNAGSTSMPTEFDNLPTIKNQPRCFASGEQLVATGPLALPTHRCVKCGSTEPGGVVRNEVVSYVNPLIWLTILVSGLITIVAYYTTRKKLEVRYYLCPSCADSRKIGELTSSLIMICGVVGMTLTTLGGPFEVFLAAFLIGLFFRIFLVRKPLRAVSHDSGAFALKGAAPELLRTLPPPKSLQGPNPQKPS